MKSFDTEHDPNAVRNAVEHAAAPEMEIDFRPMFGGIMAYVAGRPFASLSNRGLALKLDPKIQEELLAEDGARRLQYEPTDAPSKTYVLVPDGMLARPDELRRWLRLSAAYAASLAVRKPRGPKKSK